MNTPPSWSSEWNEGWRKLLPGYTVTEPLIAAPWDWGRTVLTGAMAEHEELETIKYRVTTIEQQLREAMIEANKTNVELEYQISIMEENLQTLQDNMNKELSKSYNRGLAKGGTLGFIIGVSVGLIID
jgi:TolA-binding protein